MNLEAIEQRCLAYLGDTPRVITPISELLRMLDQDEDCQGMDEARLARFLREHELFSVIDPATIERDSESAIQSELDVMTETGVLLTGRIPSNDQVLASMAHSLDTMMKALESGTEKARNDSDPKRALRVQNILKRARELHQKMNETGLTSRDPKENPSAPE
ncbi:MAG: hypothetical protein SGI88_22220 [Candidatus Hydrogenedentes bacterium]|nr:hypothetical protein [Candidatus Hydrogenedentota bacterium]